MVGGHLIFRFHQFLMDYLYLDLEFDNKKHFQEQLRYLAPVVLWEVFLRDVMETILASLETVAQITVTPLLLVRMLRLITGPILL